MTVIIQIVCSHPAKVLIRLVVVVVSTADLRAHTSEVGCSVVIVVIIVTILLMAREVGVVLGEVHLYCLVCFGSLQTPASKSS